MDVSPHQLIDILLSVNHPVLIFKSRRALRLRCAEQETAWPAAGGLLAGRGATRPHRVEQETARLVAALAARPPGNHQDPRSRSRTHKISVVWARLIFKHMGRPCALVLNPTSHNAD